MGRAAISLHGGGISLADLVTKSRFEPAAAATILLGGWWYLAATHRLAARGRQWPRRRRAAYLSALAVATLATQTGIATYDSTSFTTHVVQHVLLGMVVPVLLALGAPITLALQSAPRGLQRRLLAILHSPVVGVVTHPLTAWALFGGSMFALYFSRLYALSLHNTVLHDAIHLDFVLAGCLFFWPIVGLDPIPHRLPFGARLVYVLVALPFHTVLGLALLTQTELLAPGLSLADQRAGAAILWSAGEVMGLAAMLIVVAQWMNAEEREAVREDRRLAALLHESP